ncbi:MAG: hypothetical protein EXS16_10035 [Gemmataceae bacterium]|nr:hypothetical protein [Gemmataceae bacterium]
MIPTPLVAQLLAELNARGIEVEHISDTIRYRPLLAITPNLIQRLRAHKAELRAILVIQKARDLGNAPLAEALTEAWGERIAICIEDGKESRQTAEAIALQQLRIMSARIILDKKTSTE